MPKRPRNPDGTLATHTEDGHPIYYVTDEDEHICAVCAEKAIHDYEAPRVTDYRVLVGDEEKECDCCFRPIDMNLRHPHELHHF